MTPRGDSALAAVAGEFVSHANANVQYKYMPYVSVCAYVYKIHNICASRGIYVESRINAPHANWRTINLKCAAGATGRNTFIYRYIKTETETETDTQRAGEREGEREGLGHNSLMTFSVFICQHDFC